MSGWQRLDEGRAFERLLLDSVQDDRVPNAARRSVAMSLGLDPERASSPVAPRDVPRARDPVAPAHAGLGALGKVTLIALVGGLAALNARFDAEPALAPVADAHPVAVEPRATGGAALESPPPASVAVPSAPPEPSAPPAIERAQAPRARAAVSRRDEPAPAQPNPAQPLLREVQQLDRASAALEAGSTLAALSELDAYDQEFPRGELRLEAAVLRVRALQRAGRFALATRLAQRALEVPGSERYQAELQRVVAGERASLDKLRGAETLEGGR